MRQAAVALRVSETRVYQWVSDEAIPHFNVQQAPQFHRVELLEWAMDRELPIAVDLYGSRLDSPLTRSLERGVGKSISNTSEIGSGDLAASVVGRADRFAPRASGIALPRARSPVIRPAQPASTELYWCEPPLDIRALPISAMFVIVAPTIRQHLELLSRLSVACESHHICEAAKRPDGFSELVSIVAQWESAIVRAAS